ncbi:MAG: hypothetical protein AAGA90_16995 [Actinomycetota bacterium]
MRVLTTVAAIVAVLSTTLGVASAATTRIDATFEEPLPIAGSGVLVDGAIPGCDAPTTSTGPVGVSTFGSVTIFSGTKTISCLDGSTIDLAFFAVLRGCAASNRGIWVATGGTGTFADARGIGRLIGTYPNGDGCTATAVEDRYIGRIRT